MKQEDLCYQVSRINDLPSVPSALQRLFDIIYDEVASTRELESIIRYDQSLSAKILRVANSSYYGFRGRIPSLSRAIAVIGFEEVKRLCLCSLLVDLASDKNAPANKWRETLWKHTFAVARAATFIAEKRPWVTKEEAYMLGLLHDLGKLIMAVYFQEHFDAVLRVAAHRKIPFWNAELLYGLSHATIGKWIGVKWGLPEVHQEVMQFHHAPEESVSHKSETTLIALANILINSQNYPELLDDPFTLAYCGSLCVTEDEWGFYQKNVARIWVEVDDLWMLLN